MLSVIPRNQAIAARMTVALLALVLLCGSALERPPLAGAAGGLATSPLSIDAGPTHLRAPVGIVRLASAVGQPPVSHRHDGLAISGTAPSLDGLVPGARLCPTRGLTRLPVLDAASPLRGPPAHT